MNEVSEYVAEMARATFDEESAFNGNSTPFAKSRRWRFIADVES